MAPDVYFIHSATLPTVYLSPCMYMSPALIQINTVRMVVCNSCCTTPDTVEDIWIFAGLASNKYFITNYYCQLDMPLSSLKFSIKKWSFSNLLFWYSILLSTNYSLLFWYSILLSTNYILLFWYSILLRTNYILLFWYSIPLNTNYILYMWKFLWYEIFTAQ